MNMKINSAGSIPALTDDERLLISRAAELSARSRSHAVASCFLTPRQQRILFESGLPKDSFFYGGGAGCVRRKLIFLPDWIEAEAEGGKYPLFGTEREESFLRAAAEYGAENVWEEFISVLQLCGSGYEELTHRDWLGALTSLGIKRETLGDICVFGGETYVFAEPVAAELIEAELRRAGRDAVSARRTKLPPGFKAEIKTEETSVTVASLRLDGAVRALCGVSREEAAALVASGLTELNYFTCTETDKKIAPGDILSVRGHGKFVIKAAGETTRKGRIRVSAGKYI